ncbi:MAG: hypothetical protein AB1439_07785 [candidate division FCPU426 bacterium]
MKDDDRTISPEELLEIFSKVTKEYKKYIKPTKGGKSEYKITRAELLEIFKKVSKSI